MLKTYLVILLMLVLLLALPTPVTFSVQPPVILDTLYVGHYGWGPTRADPVRVYDTKSAELLMNVYETLIAMNGELYWDFVPLLATNVPEREDITKAITSADVDLYSPIGSSWSDASVCVGWADNNNTDMLDASDVLYMVESGGDYRTWFVQSLNAGSPVSASMWRGRYTFQTRTSPTINFINETGHTVDTFDVYDAEYSFERGLVQDQTYSPMWMFYKPFFDQMNSDIFASNTTEPTAMTLAHLIDDAVEVSFDSILTLYVGIQFPDVAFKQILSQSWASIVSKQFSISIGCWNGDLYADADGDGYPDWWTSVRRVLRSPYEISPVAINGRWCGTGPYRVSFIDAPNGIVTLSRNAGYWRGWPAPGCKSYLETIELRYIDDWQSRRDDFIQGNLDICAVPRSYNDELLDENGEPLYPEIKTIKNLRELRHCTQASFTFTIDDMAGTNPLIGSGEFPDGIPPDFFNNTHIRKAFAYAFNHTEYLNRVNGEAICRENPLIYGLMPDYYTKSPDPPYTYDADYAAAEAELKQAMFDGTSVWGSGFSFLLPFMTETSTQFITGEMIADFFAGLSTYDERTGPPFSVQMIYMDPYWWWPEPDQTPVLIIGWLPDFADADNLLRPFMYSSGDFAYYQNYTAANGWGSRKDELIDLAVKTPDGPERAAIYAELEQIYVDDCPGIMLPQLFSRKWVKYWVRGWCYGLLSAGDYYGDYYYYMWKEDTCWYDIVGVEDGPSDGVCNMRDVSYLVRKFNTAAPTPELANPDWVGTYGCKGIDPYGDRVCNMRDISWAILHFNHEDEP